MMRSFDQENFSYAGSLSNAVRHNRTERVFTANEAPPDVSYFHHEMAQTPVFPSKLAFYCEQAPTVGGATPVPFGRAAIRNGRTDTGVCSTL